MAMVVLHLGVAWDTGAHMRVHMSVHMRVLMRFHVEIRIKVHSCGLTAHASKTDSQPR